MDDSVNNYLVEFSSAGAFLQNIGSYGVGLGQLSNPRSATFDSSGNLYVNDTNNNRVVKFTRTSDASFGSLTGHITLEGANDAEQKILFTFRPAGGGYPVVVKQVITPTAVSDTGTFTIPNIPFGTYDVAIKGVCWLQKVIPGVTFSASAPTATLSVMLNGSDINGDNSVDTTDFGILVGDYNLVGDL